MNSVKENDMATLLHKSFKLTSLMEIGPAGFAVSSGCSEDEAKKLSQLLCEIIY